MAKNSTQKKVINPQEISDFITKNSIHSFATERKIDNLINSISDEKVIEELKEIKSLISKNDKSILDFFDVKLSSKEREKIFNIVSLMK